ncbi:MAG: GNAT family N-acetyltransferase [Dysgonomonas sp.]
MGNEFVKFYPEEVSQFASLKANTPENFRQLHDLFSDTQSNVILETTEEAINPAPWKLNRTSPFLQMVFEGDLSYDYISQFPIRQLGSKDVYQIQELVSLTHPGPFAQNTIVLGHYEGIFDEDHLVAMAGQRMHTTPYAEISAVCTHPDYLGRGYARQLISSQIHRIKKAGETPFLHVSVANIRALSIYKNMGFVIRRQMYIHFLDYN